MDTNSLDYTLPDELIAQEPASPRDSARMLVLDRAAGSLAMDHYRNVARYLRRGDCLVLNDTRVIRARLRGQKPTGGQVEVFLLREESPGEWSALVRPSAKVKPGTKVRFAGDLEAAVQEPLPGGRRRVVFPVTDVVSRLEERGEVPLPPYIHREKPQPRDAKCYQTIYARSHGAVAAPTAGLHFTPEVFASLDTAGVQRTTVTLHVGYGTFKPIQVERLEDHKLEAEIFEVAPETAATLNAIRKAGGRVASVGTTTTRVLETQWQGGGFVPGQGETSTYIYPPYTFKGVDILQTNFHLPRSSLLALVCAFAGTDAVMEAYRYAVRERFRFYSYGDVMLIL